MLCGHSNKHTGYIQLQIQSKNKIWGRNQIEGHIS